MKQKILHLDTLIDVSGSGQKIKCPQDVWTLDRDCCFCTENRIRFKTFMNDLKGPKQKTKRPLFQLQLYLYFYFIFYIYIFRLLYFDTISHHFLLTRYKVCTKETFCSIVCAALKIKLGECSHLFSSNDIFNLM